MKPYHIKSFIVLLVFLLVVVGNVSAVIPLQTQQDKDIAKLIQSRNYNQAIDTITNTLSQLNPKDYYIYTVGNLNYLLEEYQEAINWFNRLIEEYPNSEYYNKAMIKKIWSLENQGKLKEAYILYKDRLEYLLSPQRRYALSNLYVELARELAQETETYKPSNQDLKEAIIYYEKSLNIGLDSENEDDVLYELAYTNYDLYNGNNLNNIDLFKTLISAYPDSEWLDDSLYYIATIYFNNTQSYSSYNNINKLAREYFTRLYTNYPDSEFAPEAIYRTAQTYNFPNPYTVRDLELTAKLIEELRTKYPENEYTKKGLFNLANAYNRFSDYKSKAVSLYREFINIYGEKDKDLSPQALIEIGNIHLNRNEYEKAETVYREFIENYPAYSEWKRIQNVLISINYTKAYNLYIAGEYDEAIQKFEEFMNQYPINNRNPEIMYLIGDVFYKQEMWEEAITRWKKVVSKYPNTSSAAKSQFYIGLILEEKLMKLEEAKEAYEKVQGDYNYQQRAKDRINNLTKKELNLLSDKVFTTNDEPYISLGLRNIEKVQLKIYKLDLKEYFISKKTISKIEDLDTILIKPDYEFEVNYNEEISDAYEEYKYFDEQIPLPLEETGTYVVYVESDLFKSTTLFMISDIVMTVKSTRTESLIHLKNLLTEESEPEGNIMIASQGQIVKELTTDENGLVRLNLTELQNDGININNLRYFAYKNKNYASTDLYVGGLYTPAKSETSSYIFTDKAQYKPGDTIYYKAILRNIDEGIINLPEDEKYTINLSTTQEGEIYKNTADISKYGSIYGSIEVPDTISTSNNYASLNIRSKNYSISKSVLITRFKPAERELNIDFDSIAYELGEEIKLTISGKYLSGAPTNNVDIRYRIAGGEEKTATLDEKGQLNISLDSSLYPNIETLSVIAYFSDKPDITYSGSAFIIIKDFSITLNKTQNIYLPDEQATVEINTKDYKDQPISKELQIRLYRTYSGVREPVVDTTINTDENGTYTFKYGDDKGGTYELIAEGIGDNKKPVSNSISFDIIKKEGGRQLIILPEGLEFKVGEAKPVKIYSKLDEGLALFTIERAKILEHRFVSLEKGLNTIDIKVDETYAPNSKVSISLARQEGFYYSEKELTIQSGLDITINTDSEEYLPSSEVQLDISTKDLFGNQLPAELMIAVVDEAVLKATNTTYDDIKSVFYKYLTLNYITQDSSTPFIYRGTQTNIDADLLAERDRREYEEVIYEDEDRIYDAETSKEAKPGQAEGDTMSKMRTDEPTEEAEEEMAADMGADLGDVSQVSQQEQAMLRTLLKDTAFFRPDIISGEDGKVSVSFELPDNLTRWKIFVLGNNNRALFGMNSKNIVSTRDLVVNVDAPLELVEGDNFSFYVSLQNNSSNTISEDLKVRLLRGEENIEGEDLNFTLQPKSSTKMQTKRFTAPEYDFNLQATTPLDGERRRIPTKKWATTQRMGLEGFTDRTVFRYIEASQDIMRNTVDKKLYVRILPNTTEILKQIREQNNIYVFGAEEIAQRLIINLNYYKYLLSKESDNIPAIEEVEREIMTNINALELWGKNGYWTYSDSISNNSIDYNITALAYYSLISAKKENFEINSYILRNASENLLSYYRRLGETAYDLKAYIAFVLSLDKRISYSEINSLYTSRNSLTLRGLSFLSLALNNLNRMSEANELNDMLLKGLLEDEFHILPKNYQKNIIDSGFTYFFDWYLVQALGLYAVLDTEELTPEIEERINLIISRIDFEYRAPHFLTAASLMYYKYLIVKDEIKPDFLLKVLVNDEKLYEGRMNEVSNIIELSTENVKEKNKIEINIGGNKGKLTYEAYLEYTYDNNIPENVSNELFNRVSKGNIKPLEKRFNYPQYIIKLTEEEYNIITSGLQQKNQFQYQQQSNFDYKNFKNTKAQQQNNMLSQIETLNNYNIVKGKDAYYYIINKNYNILTNNQKNDVDIYKDQEVKQVPEGMRIPVSLDIEYTNEDRKYKYFVVEDFIPAGFSLVKDSVSGANAVKEFGNKLIFYISRGNNYGQTIKYEIIADYMGTYRSFPPKYYSIEQKFNEVIEESDKMEILDSDYDVFTNYKVSPYELYPLGVLYYEIGKYDKAINYLENLIENWNLEKSYRRNIADMLMKIAIAKGNIPEKVVYYYEILKDEFPSMRISLENIRKIANAYELVGEGEKAYYLVESLYKTYLSQEFDIPVSLFKEARYKKSYEKALDIYMDYPDFSVTKNALYGYTQLIYDKLINADKSDRTKIQIETENGTEEILLPQYLYKNTYDLLTAYLTLYPDTFNTDEISFVLMNLFFDTRQYDTAFQSGKLFIKRYPKSEYLDDYLYMSGFALFRAGRLDEAMEYLEPVAYEKFKDSEGINRDSPNKLYALRLIAETMHSKGKIDEATEIYEQIKNNFADANRTLEILQEKTMKIDDLITVPIEENTAINVKHKNIKKITAKIYKVDFVILALTEKDLSDVTKVNLSGIKPMIEKEYELEYDELYLPSETNIDLPITEMGAYLVVIRSDFGERSAIVIKSDYRIDVVEKSNGRVRVIVTDKNNNFVSGMKMYFIGSNNQSFKVTETDIRGIAEVEGINGRVMIIGNLEGQYIFYRGESGLNGYSYGYEQSVNDLLEINNQRTQLQNTNISILNSILNNFPNSISIQNMYKSTN